MDDDLEFRISDTLDIVDVVGAQLPLIPLGDEWIARCRFHFDQSYSLGLSSALGRFLCTACGAAGDVIDFERCLFRIDRREAIERLARRAGLDAGG